MSWKCDLNELVSATKGKPLLKHSICFDGFSTDSRKINQGDIFVALQGESFDAHDFLKDVIVSGGAKCIVVHRWSEDLSSLATKHLCSVILVEDTLLALQNWASYWRRKFDVFVIGITGTNGKTSTKEFLAQILKSKFSIQYSKGSFNNHWGVPLSLLQLDGTQSIMICEMGMNHGGEIQKLVEIAQPDLVCVVNVGCGHLENFSNVQGIADAKEEIYKYSSKQVKKVFNKSNSYTKKMIEKYPENSICFGTEDSEVFCKLLKHSENGLRLDFKLMIDSYTVDVPVLGRHNMENLMAACALALQCGMSARDISKAMSSCHTIWGRNQILDLASGAKLIFDAYNANPVSMGAFLELIQDLEIKGDRYLILGDMLELGESAEQIHKDIACRVAQMPFKEILYFGQFCYLFEQQWVAVKNKENSIFIDTYEESLAIPWQNMLKPSDAVFVKASRGMRLERFVKNLHPMDF